MKLISPRYFCGFLVSAVLLLFTSTGLGAVDLVEDIRIIAARVGGPVIIEITLTNKGDAPIAIHAAPGTWIFGLEVTDAEKEIVPRRVNESYQFFLDSRNGKDPVSLAPGKKIMERRLLHSEINYQQIHTLIVNIIVGIQEGDKPPELWFAQAPIALNADDPIDWLALDEAFLPSGLWSLNPTREDLERAIRYLAYSGHPDEWPFLLSILVLRRGGLNVDIGVLAQQLYTARLVELAGLDHDRLEQLQNLLADWRPDPINLELNIAQGLLENGHYCADADAVRALATQNIDLLAMFYFSNRIPAELMNEARTALVIGLAEDESW